MKNKSHKINFSAIAAGMVIVVASLYGLRAGDIFLSMLFIYVGGYLIVKA